MRARRAAGTRGQSLTEFAMVAPVLILLLFAAIDFGGYYGTQMSVQNAARAGVRFAVANPTAWSSSSSPAANTIPGVVQRAASFAAVSNNGTTIQITYWDITGATMKQCGDGSSGSFSSRNGVPQSKCVVPGTMIQLSVTYRYTPWTPLPAFAGRVFTTTATSQLLEEQ